MQNIKQTKIPVVLSADNNYAPYLGVCIKSIIENASRTNIYDIYILTSNINDDYQSRIKNMEQENVSINFYDMETVLKGLDMSLFKCPNTGNNFYSAETYYRLFLSRILESYDKILYLDCDMIILHDVADLFNIDIGDNFIGATHDLSLLIASNNYSNWADTFLKYVNDYLGMKDLNNYFQAGVMIWNLAKCREHDLTQKFLDMLQKIGTPKYVDQDVMNAVLGGKNIFWLNQKWDVVWDISFWYQGLHNLLPQKFLADYENNLAAPWIIHYTSSIKPWKKPEKKNAKYFWHYARMTPFYEEIIYKNTKASSPAVMPTFDLSIIQEALNYTQNKFKYLRYSLLSKITFGKKRKKYKQKRKNIKAKLKQVKTFLKAK